MSHVRKRHVTQMNASRQTYDEFMSHIQTNHVTHTNNSCQTRV